MKRSAGIGRACCLAVIMSLVLSLCAGAFALEPSQSFYVCDDANVISQETETYICDENYRLYDQCFGAEVVVVTVDFLDGRNSEEYAYQVFNDWALGDKDESNGVLILICPGEEKYWVTSGSGLTRELSAGTMDDILYEYMEGYFDDGDYDAAALNTFKAIVSVIDDKYGVTESQADAWYNNNGDAPQPDDMQPQQSEPAGGASMDRILGFIILIVIVIVIVAALSSIGRPRRYYGGGTYAPRPRRGFFGGYRRTPPPPARPMTPPPPPMGGRPDPGRGPGGFGGQPPRRPSSGGLFGGSRPSGGGSTRGGGFGSSRPSSSRPSSSRPSGSRPSGGGRVSSGGGHSRGGGAGRK